MDCKLGYDEALVCIEGAILNLEEVKRKIRDKEREFQWARERLLEIGSELIVDMIT